MTNRTTLHLALLSAVCACDVFDPKLYQQAGDSDGGGGVDAGLEVVPLADRCTGEVPEVESGHDPRVASTEQLTDTFDTDIAACTGSRAPGADGFFQVQMQAAEKWHFHLKVQDAEADPAIYILRSCDERACSEASALDECGAGRDEHLSFRAPATATYFVGVDSRLAGGARYELIAVRPTCGDGGQPEHSETCDDGNTEPGDGCSEDCRAEVGRGSPAEVEPNDEATNANIVIPDEDGHAVVQGSLGGRCDFDMWQLDVPRGGSVRATMLDPNGNACRLGATEFRLMMIAEDGRTVAGSGASTDDNTCPSFDESQSFADNLDGRHFLRVTTVHDEPDAIGYRLAIDVLP